MSNQQISFNLNEATDVPCDECGSLHFMPVCSMKRLSALLSPSGEEMLIPVQLFACISCKHINEEFNRI